MSEKKKSYTVLIVLIMICTFLSVFFGYLRSKSWKGYAGIGEYFFAEMEQGNRVEGELITRKTIKETLKKNGEGKTLLPRFLEIILYEDAVIIVTDKGILEKGYVYLKQPQTLPQEFDDGYLKYAHYKKTTDQMYRYEWNSRYKNAPFYHFFYNLKNKQKRNEKVL